MSRPMRAGGTVLTRAAAMLLLAICAAGSVAAEKRASFTGKPTAPIGIDYAYAGAARLASRLVIELTLSPRADFAGGTLSLRARDGLVVLSPGGDVALPAIPAGATATVTVEVMPLTVDAHYLTVFVSGRLAGVDTARSLMIPVRLAPRRLPEARGLKGTDAGQSIRAVPAVEAIR